MAAETERVEFIKRQACHIAAQLPNNKQEALRVLNYAREILCNLGAGTEPEALGEGAIIQRLVPKGQGVN